MYQHLIRSFIYLLISDALFCSALLTLSASCMFSSTNFVLCARRSTLRGRRIGEQYHLRDWRSKMTIEEIRVQTKPMTDNEIENGLVRFDLIRFGCRNDKYKYNARSAEPVHMRTVNSEVVVKGREKGQCTCTYDRARPLAITRHRTI